MIRTFRTIRTLCTLVPLLLVIGTLSSKGVAGDDAVTFHGFASLPYDCSTSWSGPVAVDALVGGISISGDIFPKGFRVGACPPPVYHFVDQDMLPSPFEPFSIIAAPRSKSIDAGSRTTGIADTIRDSA